MFYLLKGDYICSGFLGSRALGFQGLGLELECFLAVVLQPEIWVPQVFMEVCIYGT